MNDATFKRTVLMPAIYEQAVDVKMNSIIGLCFIILIKIPLYDIFQVVTN
jgi:hypothetical protein